MYIDYVQNVYLPHCISKALKSTSACSSSYLSMNKAQSFKQLRLTGNSFDIRNNKSRRC